MTRSMLIAGVLLIGAWTSPLLSANAATPTSTQDVFRFEYNVDALTQVDGYRTIRSQLKRAARKFCSANRSPGLSRANRACERKVIASVQAEFDQKSNELQLR